MARCGVILHGPVATQNPDDAGVLVSPAQPLAVSGGVGLVKDAGLPPLDLVVPIAPPSRQHADVEAKEVGLRDDPIHMFEVFLVRPGGVAADQRELAVSIGVVQPVKLGEHHGLNHGEAFPGTVLQIAGGVFAVKPLKQFPSRVA